MSVKLLVRPSHAAIALGLVALLLILASLVANLIEYSLAEIDLPGDRLIVYLFSAQAEGNVPTWFSSSLLLLCSVILATVTIAKKRAGDRYILHWGGLAATFLYLSIDEAARIHELTMAPLRSALSPHGIFYFAWVIPGLALVSVFGLTYLKFLTALPRGARNMFLLSGMIFVTGAIGLEMIGGRYFEMRGGPDLTYAVLATGEESLEMFGVIVFIYALLSYAGVYVKDIQLDLAGGEREGAAVEQQPHISLEEELQ